MAKTNKMNTRLPVLFANVLGYTRHWLDAGKPAQITPIFARNRVKLGTGASQVAVYPCHDRFYIEPDGQEILIKKDRDGWVDAKFVVNPAAWPEEPLSGDGLVLLAQVDPTLSTRVNAFVEEKGRELRKQAVNEAAKAAFDAARKTQSSRVESSTLVEIGSGSFGRKFYLGPDRRIWTREGFDYYSPAFFVSDAEAKCGWVSGVFRYPRLSHVEGELSVKVATDDGAISEEHFQKMKEGAQEAGAFEEISRKVEKAKQEARMASLGPRFPQVEPLESGYPNLSLPGKVTTSCSYELEFVEFLGYEEFSKVTSGRGYRAKVRSISLALPGAVTPQEVCPWIIRVDEARGLLYVKKENRGRVIGTRGATIKKICRLTGRRWQVKNA